MELKVTHMVEDDIDEIPLLSGSAFELGENAGKITWNNSMNYAKKNPLLKTPEAIQAAKDYFKDFGAWDDAEREAWTNEETEAMVIQFIAGDIREMEAYETYEEYQEAAMKGTVSGNLYKVDTDWYFMLSH